MNDSDKRSFQELLNGLSDYYQQNRLGVPAKQIYFESLKKYTFDQVSKGATEHVADPKEGQFFPKVANFIKHLEGGELSLDMIIAAAKLKETPLGCLCSIHIGSWDLNNQDAFYLRQRAAECLQLLPQWKARAVNGDYSDHEIYVMIKYRIHPLSPFSFGLSAPAHSTGLMARFSDIARSNQYLKFIEPAHEHSQEEKTAPMNPSISKYITQN